jgi:signal transduction histidine kinase
MPSSVVKADRAESEDARLVDAIRFLAKHDEQGFAWLDPELRVLESFGAFTDNFTPGVPAVETFDVLIGLEEELLALKTSPESEPLVLANVLPAASTNGVRVTLSVYWMARNTQFLLVISHASSFAEIEFRLAAETRARAIAEAEIAAQARLLQRINQDLAAANRDLQEFASVISHDLRAPLRGLRYAATDAKAALTSGDAALASAGINQALALSRRMSAMLTGLLEYARIGRKADVAEPVQTGDLVREIVQSVQAGCEQRIEVEGDWPVIITVAEALDIVLRNLVENAVKHHDRSDGLVVVHANPTGDHLLISVRDDGPGIDPAWHEAIFLPFRQIDDRDVVDGAGIGLALVKKTVESVGGTIDVQSDPAKARGTTFTVNWPLILPA